jgi:rhodanese-related sulfurtransferase
LSFATAAFAEDAPAGDAAKPEQELTHTQLPLKDIKKQVEEGKAVLIDCREQDEWDDGHLRDAVFVPLSKLKEAQQVPSHLPKDKPVYVHCAVGGRALTAGKILKKLGYDPRPVKAGVEELVKDGGFKEALKAK